MEIKGVTRVEIIDREKGREHIYWHYYDIEHVLLQDNNRTLKIFVKRKGENNV